MKSSRVNSIDKDVLNKDTGEVDILAKLIRLTKMITEVTTMEEERIVIHIQTRTKARRSLFKHPLLRCY